MEFEFITISITFNRNLMTNKRINLKQGLNKGRVLM